jgi:hypothetical protein
MSDLSGLLKKLNLDIDVPIMAVRMLGNKLELHLYGGEVKTVEIEPAFDVNLRGIEAVYHDIEEDQGVEAVVDEQPADDSALKAKKRGRRT